MFYKDLPQYLSNMKTVNSIETEDLNALTREMIDDKINGIQIINSEEKDKFRELVYKHRNVFNKEPGLIDVYQHELKIQDDKSFICKSYPVPMALRKTVGQEIGKLLNN